jgi:hypothetical protein
VPCTEHDKLLFAACTTITLGDEHKASFWSLGWLQGRRPKDIAPLLFGKSKKKNRMVAEALHDNAWIRDLGHRTGFTTAHLSQLVTLWNLVQGTTLRQDQEDRITWTQTPHGEYTAASAYIAQFNGCVAGPDVAIIWKTCPPGVNSSLGCSFRMRFFYGTQYDLYDRLKKDLYVIEKDLYVRIRRLRLILYGWFFSCRTIVFKGRMGSIRVLSKM